MGEETTDINPAFSRQWVCGSEQEWKENKGQGNKGQHLTIFWKKNNVENFVSCAHNRSPEIALAGIYIHFDKKDLKSQINETV